MYSAPPGPSCPTAKACIRAKPTKERDATTRPVGASRRQRTARLGVGVGEEARYHITGVSKYAGIQLELCRSGWEGDSSRAHSRAREGREEGAGAEVGHA
jgi:hypothetical protein